MPAMQETWVQSLGWEDPLEKVEKAMAPHSSTLAWKIAWAEEPGRLQSMGSLRVRHNRATSLSLFTFLLQCMKVESESEAVQSCPTLSDPMDCSLAGSSAHAIFQARVLEWGAIAFSGGKLERLLKIE